MTATPGTQVPITITGKAARLARKGRPWFFRDDLGNPGDLRPGALVRVVDDNGRSLGLGVASTTSRLALRLAGTWPGDGVPSREEFAAARIQGAVAARAHLRGADGLARGVRLVHGEADGLPGLVVDGYGDVLVLQSSHPFVEGALDAVVPALVAATGATSVVARNDIPVRELEGLPQEVRLLHGRRPGVVTIHEGDPARGVPLQFAVDVWQGHKTGFYLDQRPARTRVRELASRQVAAGSGRPRMLDVFAYQGGFALSALAGGAGEALAVDQDGGALERAAQAAGAQGLTGFQTHVGNAFDILRDLRAAGEAFDLVVIDPPAFAKQRKDLAGAERGYRDLFRVGLRMLRPGGHLLACSCSHHMDATRFEGVVRQAAADLKFPVLLRERLGAGDDHPVLLAHPESEYLKVLRVQRGG